MKEEVIRASSIGINKSIDEVNAVVETEHGEQNSAIVGIRRDSTTLAKRTSLKLNA
jgi:hypothetical protein